AWGWPDLAWRYATATATATAWTAHRIARHRTSGRDCHWRKEVLLKLAALRSVPSPQAETALERACLCARVAADLKARDVVVLDMREVTPLYDFFVLATGISRRQIHSLAEEIDDALRAEGEIRRGIEGYESSRWVVQDYGD